MWSTHNCRAHRGFQFLLDAKVTGDGENTQIGIESNILLFIVCFCCVLKGLTPCWFARIVMDPLPISCIRMLNAIGVANVKGLNYLAVGCTCGQTMGQVTWGHSQPHSWHAKIYTPYIQFANNVSSCMWVLRNNVVRPPNSVIYPTCEMTNNRRR